MSKQTPKQQSLCNNKFDGLMNAAPHKRYKSFAVTVAESAAARRGRNFRMAGGNVRRRRLHGQAVLQDGRA